MFTIRPLNSTDSLTLMMLHLKFANKLLAGGQYLNALKYYEKCFEYAKQRVLIRNSEADLQLCIIVIDKLSILCHEAKDGKMKSEYDTITDKLIEIQREEKHKEIPILVKVFEEKKVM